VVQFGSVHFPLFPFFRGKANQKPKIHLKIPGSSKINGLFWGVVDYPFPLHNSSKKILNAKLMLKYYKIQEKNSKGTKKIN